VVVSDVAAERLSPDEPVCVVTRIRFGKWRSIPSAVFRFRRLNRIGRRQVPGLVEAHVRIRSDATLLIVSIWENELALIRFTTLHAHVNAVRWSIRKQGEVWSGVFALVGTSSMSKPWIGTIRHWQPLAMSQAASSQPECVAADER
jgi:hypothetical protein